MFQNYFLPFFFIIFMALFALNGLMMLISPVLWSRMPRFLQLRGPTSPADLVKISSERLEIRIFGAVLVGFVLIISHNLWWKHGGMQIRLALAAICLLLVAAASIASNYFMTEVIFALNGRRPTGDQVSHFGLDRMNFFSILAEYRREFPDGHAHLLFVSACFVGFVALMTAAACVGLLSHW